MSETQNKNNLPLVSIIVPTYNGEEFLEDAIESVLNQSFQNYELIISDDDSNDKTNEIIDKYGDEPRLSFFQNGQRLGIGGNWNQGLKRTNGRYIKILCQDDILKPNYIKEAVEVLENDDSISLVTTFEKFFGDSDKVRNENDIPFSGKVEGYKAFKSVLKEGNWIGGPTAVTFRKSDLIVGEFDTDLKCGLDYEMWLRILKKGNLYIIPKILYQSRIHHEQATSDCRENLGFEKDDIRILGKLKSKPELYPNISESEIEKSLIFSVRILINKSLKMKREKIIPTGKFLKKYIGGLRTTFFLTRGVLMRLVTKFRQF